MGFDLHFRSLASNKDIKQTIDFLFNKDLNYPKYDEWIMKTEHELYSGYKNAFICLSGGKMIADLIFQPHKEMPRFRELKNLRVLPVYRRRYIANFLLRQAEVEDSELFDAIVIDSRSDQKDVLFLLASNGYSQLGKRALYDDNEDIIMIKTKVKDDKMIYSAKNVILN
ncbi:hypothetical protein ACFL1H_02455 [Nanoarchaeota archaeon]